MTKHSIDHQALRAKYNPDGSLLRRDQLELMKMLDVVAQICKQHDIKWWLSSGTLLGAARHQGFIPWDDDLDIVLMREDYKRLEKILHSLDSDEFVFHSIKASFAKRATLTFANGVQSYKKYTF